MPISNGIVLPDLLSNGQTADATQVMADLNTLLASVNRALLDAGGTAGMNAQNTAIHNLADGVAAQDAVAFHQIAAALASYAPLASPAFTGTASFVALISSGAAAFASMALTAPLSISSGGTGATSGGAARTALGAAASGSNSDITALTGLTTPLALNKGGTGQTTQATAFAAIAVVASSLAATGYITLANGLTLQWGRQTVAAGSSATITYAPAYSTWVQPFITSAVADLNGTDNRNCGVGNYGGLTTFEMWNANTLSLDVSWFAIGV
jgi:hypothetical protein